MSDATMTFRVEETLKTNFLRQPRRRTEPAPNCCATLCVILSDSSKKRHCMTHGSGNRYGPDSIPPMPDTWYPMPKLKQNLPPGARPECRVRPLPLGLKGLPNKQLAKNIHPRLPLAPAAIPLRDRISPLSPEKCQAKRFKLDLVGGWRDL